MKNENQTELQVNNKQVTDFIIYTDERMRNAERLLNTAIFEMESMQLKNKTQSEERDNITALLSGAMALVTQTKEIADKYL